MIETHEILSIADGGEVLKMEVNWNPDDPKTNKCQQIKFIHHDGKVSYVDRDHLIAAIFTIGTEDQQSKLVPHAIQEIRNYETILGINANKDIKKGEKINVRVRIPLPLTGEQISLLGAKVGGEGKAPTKENLISSPYK